MELRYMGTSVGLKDINSSTSVEVVFCDVCCFLYCGFSD